MNILEHRGYRSKRVFKSVRKIDLNEFNNCFQAGTGNTAPWRVVLATATCTASARPTTTWSGSAGASQGGLDPVAIFILNKTARIEKTMTKVCTHKYFSHGPLYWLVIYFQINNQ